MSELNKGKYEVLRLIRSNILKCFETLGIPTGANGWECMESDQAKIVNREDKVVLLKMKGFQRVGWQSSRFLWDSDGQGFRTPENWIEEQEWEVKILVKRSSHEPITADTVAPMDIAAYLVMWFNREGCAVFREHNCGNLFVKSKDIKLYNDSSNLNQEAVSFPLKLQVPKQVVLKTDPAEVVFEGASGY